MGLLAISSSAIRLLIAMALAIKAIYRVGDDRVGQWSKAVTVTVGG
jgi:hypothetical protein